MTTNTSCTSCNYCYYCYHCYYCKNLKMTEYNLFCYSEKYNDNNSFQQKRYRVFNKQLTEKRYDEVFKLVKEILPTNSKLKLDDFWKSVTQEQWKKLLAIPEAKDFKEGFEYISGQKIEDDKVKITVENKDIYISRDSAKALGLI